MEARGSCRGYGYMTPTEFEMKFIEEKKLREYEAA
jgi:hypothetical protein